MSRVSSNHKQVASDGDSPTAQKPEEGAAAGLVKNASQALSDAVHKLHLDPEFINWAQQMAIATIGVTGPVRRSFKTQPALIGAGIAALAAGGVLIGVALIRDINATNQSLVRHDNN